MLVVSVTVAPSFMMATTVAMRAPRRLFLDRQELTIKQTAHPAVEHDGVTVLVFGDLLRHFAKMLL
jgi:hypothetical protein